MATNVLRNFVFSAFLVSVIFAYYASGADRGSHSKAEVHWRYFGIYGVQNWSLVYPDCDEISHRRQSPVNIVRSATEENTTLTQIKLVVNLTIRSPVTLINNGHTVNFDFNKTSIHISGGDLPGKFRVGGVHFHWGRKDTEGSEHTIDGKRFPMEMHIVTYDESRYAGVIEASNGDNSIAVLGVLFQLSTADNWALDPIIDHLRDVPVADHPFYIPYFDLRTLLPANASRYYRYLGSLTTPPCSESVVWSVFEDKVSISHHQMHEFRKLQEMLEPDGTIDFLVDNWRVTEPLYDRKIQRSFTNGVDFTFSVMSQTALIATMSVVLQLFA